MVNDVRLESFCDSRFSSLIRRSYLGSCGILLTASDTYASENPVGVVIALYEI